jgi:GT2 family glycosyltransferase
LSPNETYPQHVVTTVIVAHDGAAWLPQVIESLLEQTRPVQRVVAVDTGSQDRSGAVLSGLLGQPVVFGMDRGAGYGAAVARALAHRSANVNIPGPGGLPAQERVEWIWLLHDDCEPAPDALEQLLRGAAETRSAAVLGPKVMDWADRGVILEAGVTIDTAGRRITGIEPREVDQGQHDGDRDALAVGSAGMLIRRDVWDQVGGFDPGMMLFRDDVDFCWRVHAAGYRVRVITDAVVFHVEAAARRRRPLSAARRPRQLDRRNAMFTLLANLPTGPMLASLAGNVAVSLLRTAFFLLAKRPAAGLDEISALGSVLGHPIQLLHARRRRSRGRRAAYGRLRADLPPGRSLRRVAEFAAAATSRSAQVDTAGSHHATDDPTEDDSLLIDTGLAQRILTHPGVLLFAGLTLVALVAGRSLLSGGPLGGGALVPAWGGASGLWREYLQGFHPAGIGSGSTGPPYIAIVAALATVLGSKPWLAVDVIMLGCVPLAGAFAYLAIRKVTRSALVRVWAAAAYALLPIAMGAIAAGRLGTAVVFALIPLIALLAGRMFTQPPRRATRAAWATGLVIAIAAAFVPLTWVVAVLAAVVTAVTVGIGRPSVLRNLGIVTVVPPVLLLPWTFQLAAHPAQLLLEVGVQQRGLASPGLPARSLLLLSPGGPGLPPVWVTAGLAVAAVAALVFSRHRGLLIVGWGAAIFGLAVAIAVSRVVVTPAAGGPAVPAWPGLALAIVGAGLVLAAATAGDALPRLTGGANPARLGAVRTAGAAVLALAACSAPLLSAGYWLINGVSGPVAPTAAPVVPVLVSASSASGLELRTLVLRSAHGQRSYALERGLNPSLGDADLLPVASAQHALDNAVATLVAPGGGEADDQGQSLAQFDIGFVLIPAPVDQGLATLLNGVAGLRPVTATSAFALWRLTDVPARARVVEPNGTMVALRSGPTSVSDAPAPAAGGILELAEPAGGWSATLDGRALTQVPSPAGPWAQAFRLPRGGGRVTISRHQGGHDIALVIEALALALVAVLALPGARISAAEAAGAGAAGRGGRRDAPAPGRSGSGGRRLAREQAAGRSARRLRPGRAARRGGRAAALAGSAGVETAGPAGPPDPRMARSPDARSPCAQSPGGPADRILAGQAGRPLGGPSSLAPDSSSGPRADWPGGAQEQSWDDTGPQPGWPGAGQRPSRDEAGQRPGWDEAGQRPDWPGGGQQPGWGEAGQRPDWPGRGQEPGWGDTGPGWAPQQPGWAPQQPDWSAERPAEWPAGRPAAQPSGRPAAQPAGRSAGPSPGWPSGSGDPLDPLPPADGPGPPWTGSAAGEVRPPRWPVPDRDPEGDNW